MGDQTLNLLSEKLDSLLNTLERIAPAAPVTPNFEESDAFLWEIDGEHFRPVEAVSGVRFEDLKGVDLVRDKLRANTEYFAQGAAANNVLLWGARGMGKSSLVKAVHAHINKASIGEANLKLVEINRDDIQSLPVLMRHLRASRYRFILFCDDLSFDGDDASYKSLKAALDGGIEGRPVNVLFYATSNRRHLIPRDMMENERSTAINPSEAIEEKVSLSDRFGLWLGFHKCDQDTYLEMIDGYISRFELKGETAEIHHAALEWSTTRGARSGRVAWQFIQDLAGKQGIALSPKASD